jgi:hypothetical protein
MFGLKINHLATLGQRRLGEKKVTNRWYTIKILAKTFVHKSLGTGRRMNA